MKWLIKDKSPKGFVDEDVLKLLEILNEKYETTSSCSGRITLMSGLRKADSEWVYKTHKKADAEEIYDVLKKHKKLKFYFEPLIIHVKCKSIESAEKVLELLHKNGFKKSGLKSFNGFLIEITEPGRMETVLTSDLSLDYIEILVNEANRRLKKTKENIKKLEEIFV
jgi:tRNA wybutosine-synthesizing protein 3